MKTLIQPGVSTQDPLNNSAFCLCVIPHLWNVFTTFLFLSKYHMYFKAWLTYYLLWETPSNHTFFTHNSHPINYM